LRHGEVQESLLEQLVTAKPAVQNEIARALGARGDRAAVPKLAQLAKTGPDSVRTTAFDSLALLVGETEMPLMVKLVVEANTELTRVTAVEALSSALMRMQAERGHVNVEPVARALETGSAETRIALLPVTSTLADSHIRSAVRAAVRDSNPAVHEAAVRAICDTTDPELLGDLLQVACAAPQTRLNPLAIRACVRLTTQDEASKYPDSRKVETLKAILATSLSDDEKRVVLAGLGEIHNVEAFELVEPMLDDGVVRSEAVRAAVKIAPHLADTKRVETTLGRILSMAIDPATQQIVEAALKQARARADQPK
jgi:HEAT repeat protein